MICTHPFVFFKYVCLIVYVYTIYVFFTFIRNNIFLQYDLHLFLQSSGLHQKTICKTYCTTYNPPSQVTPGGMPFSISKRPPKRWQNASQPGPSCPMSIAEQLHTFDDWDPPGSLDEFFKTRNVSRDRWDEDVNNNTYFFLGDDQTKQKGKYTLSLSINDVKTYVGLIIFSLNLLHLFEKDVGEWCFVSGNLQLLGSTVQIVCDDEFGWSWWGLY